MTPSPSTLARQEADAQLAEANDWTAKLSTFVIQNDADEANIVGVIQETKSRAKALEAKRTEITKPLNEALRAVNALFKPPKDRFEALERMLKGKVVAYMTAKQAANVAAIQAAAVAPTPQAAQQTLARVQLVEAPQSVSVRHVWKFEVTDPDVVPRELCSPDVNKIGRMDPGTPVPGVRWFQEPVTTVRGAR